MEIVKIECKKNAKTMFLYSISVSGMILLCMLLFPTLKNQSAQMEQMYTSMGSFTTALGMDQVSITSVIGYFAIECGTVLGLGGVLYCGMLGIGMVVGEEQYHTVEFLYTHPRTRTRILLEKFLAMNLCIGGFYLINLFMSLLSFLWLKESFPIDKLILIFLFQYILGMEIAGMSFGISCFLRSGKLFAGIGIGFFFYCLDLYDNMQKHATVLRYLTPFSYASPVVILSKHGMEGKYLIAGMIQLMLFLGVGYFHFQKKDFYS